MFCRHRLDYLGSGDTGTEAFLVGDPVFDHRVFDVGTLFRSQRAIVGPRNQHRPDLGLRALRAVCGRRGDGGGFHRVSRRRWRRGRFATACCSGLCVPIAMYLTALWLVRDRASKHGSLHWLLLVVAALALASSAFASHALELMAMLLAITVAIRRRLYPAGLREGGEHD